MNNDEGKVPKSLELLIQVSAWTGGIIAAAVGGLLYAMISKDTPPEAIVFFKIIVIPLCLSLLGTWYVQIHSALHARALENDEAKSASPAATGALPAARGAPEQKHEAPVRTSEDTSGEDSKASSRGNIGISMFAQAIFQAVALLAIIVAVLLYKGSGSNDGQAWSLIANESDEEHISYLLKVPMPQAKGKPVATLRLLVSDPNGNWHVCTIDPTAADAQKQCPAGASTTVRPELRLMGKPILFHELEYKLTYVFDRRPVDLTPMACEAKREILKASAGGVLVVGSHDRNRITRGAVDSNESLARLRAMTVATFLAEENDCGVAVQSVISLNAAPVIATKDTRAGSDLAADRSVSIYALVAADSRR